ncbi:MAG TPA: mercuric reductase [Cyclobacteriaceae bacterium]|nr:mercuric reductase [Cyclobacteriaceae bacterium]
MKHYDAIILGAGQSGMPLARQISKKGFKVALIEQEQVGGTCINDGCSPTKTMVASAKVAHFVSRAEDFGIEVPAFTVNQKKVKNRKQYIVELFRGGAQSRLDKAVNVEIIKGKGTFVTDKVIRITEKNGETRDIEGDKIFINTGSETIIPDIEGLKKTPYLTSTTIMELEKTPEHLIVLGGGYIGLEFAQMFQRFGSKVTILDRAERLVPREDVDVCEEISAIFNRTGIDTVFNADVYKVAQDTNGQIRLHYRDKSGNQELSGSHLLVAVGRKPTSGALGLEKIGVKRTEQGHVSINEYFETSVQDIYALGDVAGSPPFTHMAFHDASLAFDHVYENKSKSNKERLAPYCVFIDPQLARIGLNEQEAKQKNIVYKSGKFWMKHAGRSLEADEKDGFFKVLVDPETDQILGATILSMDGGEILAVIQMAMVGKIPYQVIQTLPIAHPTLAESLNNLMMDVDN